LFLSVTNFIVFSPTLFHGETYGEIQGEV